MTPNVKYLLESAAADIRAAVYMDNDEATITDRDILDVLEDYNFTVLNGDTLADVMKAEALEKIWDKITEEDINRLTETCTWFYGFEELLGVYFAHATCCNRTHDLDGKEEYAYCPHCGKKINHIFLKQ